MCIAECLSFSIGNLHSSGGRFHKDIFQLEIYCFVTGVDEMSAPVLFFYSLSMLSTLFMFSVSPRLL